MLSARVQSTGNVAQVCLFHWYQPSQYGSTNLLKQEIHFLKECFRKSYATTKYIAILCPENEAICPFFLNALQRMLIKEEKIFADNIFTT